MDTITVPIVATTTVTPPNNKTLIIIGAVGIGALLIGLAVASGGKK
jgi:hypothetical protein